MASEAVSIPDWSDVERVHGSSMVSDVVRCLKADLFELRGPWDSGSGHLFQHACLLSLG